MPFLLTSSVNSAPSRAGRGVAGVEHDLALERRAVVLAELRQRLVRHRDEQRVAERDRLLDRAGLREFAETGNQVLELFGVARGEQNLVTVLHPETADRAADIAGADNADMHLGALRPHAGRPQGRAQDERAAGAKKHRAAGDRLNTSLGIGNLLPFHSFHPNVW